MIFGAFLLFDDAMLSVNHAVCKRIKRFIQKLEFGVTFCRIIPSTLSILRYVHKPSAYRCQTRVSLCIILWNERPVELVETRAEEPIEEL